MLADAERIVARQDAPPLLGEFPGVGELTQQKQPPDAVFRFERAVTRIGNTRLRPWNMTLSSYTALRILVNQPRSRRWAPRC